MAFPFPKSKLIYVESQYNTNVCCMCFMYISNRVYLFAYIIRDYLVLYIRVTYGDPICMRVTCGDTPPPLQRDTT